MVCLSMNSNTKQTQKIALLYPTNQKEFNTRFNTEEACINYLEQLRWPNGISCSHCNHDKVWVTRAGNYKCASCRKRTTALSNTIFHKNRISLIDWTNAAWYMTEQQAGINAKTLSEKLNIRMQTAWVMLHRYRYVMQQANSYIKLTGTVEVDETFVGGSKSGAKGRGAAGKEIVVIAAEQLSKGSGNIRMAVSPTASGKDLMRFIKPPVEKGSEIKTDTWKGYYQVKKKGYDHTVINMSASPSPAHVKMPLVHQVASAFDHWWLGTYHGSMSAEHLDAYLAEFCFRQNRRANNKPGELFTSSWNMPYTARLLLTRK